MLVAVDAKQLEWRAILQLSHDPVGIQEVREGQDTHELNRVAFELPTRRDAKFYLFRTIFRGSGFAFANDPLFMHVSTDPRYWDDIGTKFYTKYAGIDAKHKEWADTVMRGELLVGPSGRCWDIPIRRDWRGEIKVPWTTLTNYPVQGTSADVMMLARLSFWRRLQSLDIPALLVSTVHDSIVVDVPEKYLKDIARLFYEVFDDLVENFKRVFKYEWVVPLEGEVKAGMNLKEMHEITRDMLDTPGELV